MKHQISLKFVVNSRKSPTECFKLPNEIYGKAVNLKTQVFKYLKHFESATGK